MSINRYAARRDDSEAEIVDALRLVGARVWRIDRPWDLIVGWQGRLYGLEVKTRKRRLTEVQEHVIRECRADGLPVAVVRSVSDALQAIGAVR